MADWHHGHHYGGGSRWSVGIGIGVPLVPPPPAYYGPYYGPRYYDAPYYYDRPVVVGREVGGDVVVDAQRALARRGYYRGPIDGAFGPGTRAAVCAWQSDCRLAVTGRLDGETLRSLAL